MPERNTAARAAAENTKPSTKYTYNYTHLPPLAMVGAVTEGEAFSARPDWVHLVARAALKILINTIMIDVKNKGGNVELVQAMELHSAPTERKSQNVLQAINISPLRGEPKRKNLASKKSSRRRKE